ncbi:LysE family translocator [Saccharospirillum alexandrii]|uniref:LysE family translocator n=1 Tax=Saccharospirillum alexandrii TaxID=2448477 RepID=UPI000FDAC203|nr:LysE family transporter [Saccharospirillum alexandrii]
MVEILAYALGIMYSPGPVNIISLNAGLQGHNRLLFCVGVGCAMLSLFLLFGYTGAWLVTPRYQVLVSLAGSVYIAYLAYKVARASVSINTTSLAPDQTLNFSSGLFMQLLNPKSFVAIVPIVTVQFPAAGIEGWAILFWSVLLATLAFGAPTTYMLMGKRLGKRIHRSSYLRLLNLAMALLLLYVAIDIAYRPIYLLWV